MSSRVAEKDGQPRVERALVQPRAGAHSALVAGGVER